ncbi:MAG: RHS repeat-associated core domain-containing protein, partial [Bacteroidota bacterium]
MIDAPVVQATYYIHDHLGNTRVNYYYNCSGDHEGYILESVLNYYPYGKILEEYYSFGPSEKYLTTHHERDLESGLDYRGARMYDSDVGRFLSLDPLAMEFPGWSDYNYVLGNPVMFIDPDGRAPTDPPTTNYYNQNGDLVKTVKGGGENYIVFTNKTRLKTVNKAIKDGKLLKFPSKEVRREMALAVNRSNSPTEDDTQGGFHEESIAWGRDESGTETILRGPPGEYSDPSEDAMAPTEFPDLHSFFQLDGTAHVHPAGTKNGFGFDDKPSGEDILIQGDLESSEHIGPDLGYFLDRPISGPSYILAPGVNKVHIYSGMNNNIDGEFPLDA